MEYLIIALIITIFVVMLKFIFGFNIKEIKKVAENKELDSIASKLPKNEQICKWYLNKLNNATTKIEEKTDTKNCMYIAQTDKIIIADIQDSYTRIQTIAHECIHSIQDRKLLNFNFIFSNIYLIYFLVISVLAIFKAIPYKTAFLGVLMLFGMIYFLVRAYLENDAMIKAKYLAKDYLEETKIVSKKEIDMLVDEYTKINKVGIKGMNYCLFLSICVKIIIFCLLCYIF